MSYFTVEPWNRVQLRVHDDFVSHEDGKDFPSVRDLGWGPVSDNKGGP